MLWLLHLWVLRVDASKGHSLAKAQIQQAKSLRELSADDLPGSPIFGIFIGFLIRFNVFHQVFNDFHKDLMGFPWFSSISTDEKGVQQGWPRRTRLEGRKRVAVNARGARRVPPQKDREQVGTVTARSLEKTHEKAINRPNCLHLSIWSLWAQCLSACQDTLERHVLPFLCAMRQWLNLPAHGGLRSTWMGEFCECEGPCQRVLEELKERRPF